MLPSASPTSFKGAVAPAGWWGLSQHLPGTAGHPTRATSALQSLCRNSSSLPRLPCDPHFHSDLRMGHHRLQIGDKGIMDTVSSQRGRTMHIFLLHYQTCCKSSLTEAFSSREEEWETPDQEIQMTLVEATHSSDGSVWAGVVCGSKSTDWKSRARKVHGTSAVGLGNTVGHTPVQVTLN